MNNDTHYLSWRNKVTGPFTLDEIHEKLRSRELNSLCKVQVNGDWVLLRSFLSRANFTAAPQEETIHQESYTESVPTPAEATFTPENYNHSGSTAPALDIHIVKSGQQTGPFSREQILSMLQSGVISERDSSWHEGMDNWKPLNEVLNLHSASVPEIMDPLTVGRPALFGNRLGAYIIDALIIYLLTFAVGFIFGFHFGYVSEEFSWLLVVVVTWMYFALMESSTKQASLGKLACGLIVTDMDGERIGFGAATGRYFGKFISGFILCIGYLMCLWTEQKQCLHDMMAGCLVLSKK